MTYPAVRESAKVPLVVTGFPETESPVGVVISTDVTVPDPPAAGKPRVEVATH